MEQSCSITHGNHRKMISALHQIESQMRSPKSTTDPKRPLKDKAVTFQPNAPKCSIGCI